MAVKEGLIKAEGELEAARRSPGTADFGRLRAILQTDAISPASRVVARNGATLQEETLSWLRVQESISVYLRGVAEISAESLRASQQ